MSAKEDADYQKWVEEKSKEYPEDLRKQFEAVASHEATKDTFRDGLRQNDYYSRLNKLASERKALESAQAEQESWYNRAKPEYDRMETEHQKAISRQKALEAQIKALDLEDVVSIPNKNEVADVSTPRELEELKQRLNAIDSALPVILGDMYKVVQRSVTEKWDIDPSVVLRHALNKRVNPSQAFDELTAPEREKRNEARIEDLRKKAFEEGRKDALSKIPSPDRLRPSGPSIVDTMRDAKPNDNVNRVDEAVRQFMALGDGVPV